ncbi:MAG: carboxymuconolactone decarboxylase family protein [Haloferacaceae archaeon]
MARISLVDHEDLPPEKRDLLEVLSDPESVPEEYRHLLTSKTRNVFRTIGHQPAVLELFRELGGELWEEVGLTTRQRELLVLGVARALDSAYVWHQHVRIALSNGFTEEEVRAIAAGEFDAFDDEEATLLAYTAAFARGEVDDAVHEAAAAVFDEPMLVGVGMSVCFYLTIIRTMDAFAVETEEPFVGWDLENV